MQTNTGNDPEFNRKILIIAAAIVSDWTKQIGSRACSDTPSEILALIAELRPEYQDHLHKQYELVNSGSQDYVDGDFMMGFGIIAGGAIEVALKTLAVETQK